MSKRYSQNIIIRSFPTDKDYEDWVVVDTFFRMGNQYLVVVSKEEFEQEQEEKVAIHFIEVSKKINGVRDMRFVDDNRSDYLFDCYMEEEDDDEIAYVYENNLLDDISNEMVSIGNNQYRCFREEANTQPWAVLDTLLYQRRKFHLCAPIFLQNGTYTFQTSTPEGKLTVEDVLLIEVMNYRHNSRDLEVDKEWKCVMDDNLLKELDTVIREKIKDLNFIKGGQK